MERAGEGAIAPFAHVMILVLFFLFLAADAENAVIVQRHINIILLYTGKFSSNSECLIAFTHIHIGLEIAREIMKPTHGREVENASPNTAS